MTKIIIYQFFINFYFTHFVFLFYVYVKISLSRQIHLEPLDLHPFHETFNYLSFFLIELFFMFFTTFKLKYEFII